MQWDFIPWRYLHILHFAVKFLFINEYICQRLLQCEPTMHDALWGLFDHMLEKKKNSATLSTEKQRVDLHFCACTLYSLSLSLSLLPLCFWRVTSVECASLISLDISLSSFAAFVSCLFSRLRAKGVRPSPTLQSGDLPLSKKKHHSSRAFICLKVCFDAEQLFL